MSDQQTIKFDVPLIMADSVMFALRDRELLHTIPFKSVDEFARALFEDAFLALLVGRLTNHGPEAIMAARLYDLSSNKL